MALNEQPAAVVKPVPQCALAVRPLQYRHYHCRHIFLALFTSAVYEGPSSFEVYVNKTVKEVITFNIHYVLAIRSAYEPIVLRIR